MSLCANLSGEDNESQQYDEVMTISISTMKAYNVMMMIIILLICTCRMQVDNVACVAKARLVS